MFTNEIIYNTLSHTHTHSQTVWYRYCSFWNGRFLTFSRLERKNRENIQREIHRMLLMTWNGNEWVWALVVFFSFCLAISWFHAHSVEVPHLVSTKLELTFVWIIETFVTAYAVCCFYVKVSKNMSIFSYLSTVRRFNKYVYKYRCRPKANIYIPPLENNNSGRIIVHMLKDDISTFCKYLSFVSILWSIWFEVLYKRGWYCRTDTRVHSRTRDHLLIIIRAEND